MTQSLEAVVPFQSYKFLTMTLNKKYEVSTSELNEEYKEWLGDESHALSVFQRYLKDKKLVPSDRDISGHLLRLMSFLPLTPYAEEQDSYQQMLRLHNFCNCTTIEDRAAIDAFLDSFLDKFCAKSKKALLQKRFQSSDERLKFVNVESQMEIILSSGLCRKLLKRHLLSAPFDIWQIYLENVVTFFKDCLSDVTFILRPDHVTATCTNYVNDCRGYDVFIFWEMILRSEPISFEENVFEANVRDSDLLTRGRRCEIQAYYHGTKPKR